MVEDKLKNQGNNGTKEKVVLKTCELHMQSGLKRKEVNSRDGGRKEGNTSVRKQRRVCKS